MMASSTRRSRFSMTPHRVLVSLAGASLRALLYSHRDGGLVRSGPCPPVGASIQPEEPVVSLALENSRRWTLSDRGTGFAADLSGGAFQGAEVYFRRARGPSARGCGRRMRRRSRRRELRLRRGRL